MDVIGKAISHSRPAGTSPDGKPGRGAGHRDFTAGNITAAFRFHANNSKLDARGMGDHDDKYRTLSLKADGTFTDYNEHLWDLRSEWVTEGVSCIVYGGTYTLDLPQIELRYSKIVSKTNDVVTGKEELAADEPLDEPVVTSGTLSADGKSLKVQRFPGGEAEPQTLLVGGRHKIHGGQYS